MIRFLIIVLFVFVLFSNMLFTMNENSNWVFGYNAGITFGTSNGIPIALDSSSIYNFEGSACISDSDGKLVCYTDGINIYNKNNRVVNGKDSLLYSHLSATQSAIIIPIPSRLHEYYIFTSDAGEYYIDENGDNYVNKGFNYTKIRVFNDKILIDSLNVNLLAKSTEKVSATKHSNNRDYWVVTRGWNNDLFDVYLVTSAGIAVSKSQSIGTKIADNWKESIGYMKFSANGQYLSYVCEGRNYFELFKFDNSRGIFSEPLVIPTGSRFYNYGIEFSASGRYVYVSESKNGEIYRYDISNYNVSEISKSEKRVYKETGETFLGALQIGLNEKIYFSRFKYPYLGLISEPDSVDCDIVADGVYLANDTYGVNSYGLPNMVQSFNKFNVNLEDTIVCQYSDLVITPDINYRNSSMVFEWSGPNNFKSNSFEIKFNSIDSVNAGMYYLRTVYGDKVLYDSINICVLASPKAVIEGQNYICGNVSISLKSKYQKGGYKYRWNTGSTEPFIEVNKAGVYILEVTNDNNCSDSDTLLVSGSIVDVGFSVDSIYLDRICPTMEVRRSICIANNEMNDIKLVKIISGDSAIKIGDVSNVVINGKGSFCFDVVIKSDLPRLIDDSIRIVIESVDCQMDYYVRVRGRVVISTIAKVDNYEESPGDYLYVDIQIDNICASSSMEAYYETSITYRSDYFHLDSVVNGSILYRMVGDSVVVVGLVSKMFDFTGELPIMRLCGTVLAGGAEKTPIAINYMKWSDDLIESSISNGSLKVNACAIELRPIRVFRASELVSYQNEDGDMIIKYSTGVPGRHNIIIYDLNGTIMGEFSLMNDNNLDVEKEFVLKKQYLASGLYIILLRNEFYSTIYKQIILK